MNKSNAPKVSANAAAGIPAAGDFHTHVSPFRITVSILCERYLTKPIAKSTENTKICDQPNSEKSQI